LSASAAAGVSNTPFAEINDVARRGERPSGGAWLTQPMPLSRAD
jgi:hypothetical protein